MVITALLTTIGATQTFTDVLLNIAASYGAAHVPLLNSVDFEKHAAKCYENAANLFYAKGGVHALFILKFQILKSGKNTVQTTIRRRNG